MPGDRSLWLLVPSPVRRLPADLAAVVAVVFLVVAATLVPGLAETPLRVVVGLPFALFVPGYAFVAALFPEADDAADDLADGDESDGTESALPHSRAGITGLERVALSFGTSIAVVPLLGLALNFTPWGIRLVPVLVAVGGFTLVATWIAAVRRWELPTEERFGVPYRRWIGAARAELFQLETRTDTVLNVLLVLSLVLATASVAYAVAVPKQGESFTEFYLLTQNETGSFVADDYPTEFTRGENESVFVGIENHEHRQMNYTVVMTLQRVEMENNSTRVLEQEQLQQYRAFLGPNETSLREREIAPTMTGTRLRLQFLLYAGEPPARPTEANAYRELHLWVNVSRPSSAAG